MAQSFFQPGVECDTVAAGRTSDPWKTWCDCMFQPGSADWNRCVARACLLAWGCPNPSKGGASDPFNAHPGMLAAPWTDLGAAARSIPKRNASVAYTATGATVINLNEWTPLNLWQQYWLNPAHYAVLLGQLSLVLPLIPIAGPVIATAMRASAFAPPIQLLPLASAEVAARKLDPVKAILEPAGKGTVKNLGMVLAYLGNCGVGANIPCGAGLAVKRVAQDQIDTDRIKNYDPTTRAITVFMAKEGDRLVEAVTKSVMGGVGKALVTQVFTVLESGFLAARDVARAVGDQAAVDVCTLLHRAAEVGGVIARGIERRKTPAEIADDVCDNLLGFRPSVFFNLLKENASAATAMVKSAQRAQGSGFEKALGVVNAIGNGFNDIAKVILDFERQLGTSLGDLSALFSGAAGALGGTRDVVATMQQNVIAATAAASGASMGIASTPSVAFIGPSGIPVVRSSPAAPPPTKSKPMNLTLIIAAVGGAAGAVLGGPIGGVSGAALGAAAGALIGKNDGETYNTATPYNPATGITAMPVVNPDTGKVTVVPFKTVGQTIDPNSPLGRAMAEAKAKRMAAGALSGFGFLPKTMVAKTGFAPVNLPVAMAKTGITAAYAQDAKYVTAIGQTGKAQFVDTRDFPPKESPPPMPFVMFTTAGGDDGSAAKEAAAKEAAAKAAAVAAAAESNARAVAMREALNRAMKQQEEQGARIDVSVQPRYIDTKADEPVLVPGTTGPQVIWPRPKSKMPLILGLSAAGVIGYALLRRRTS